MSYEQPPQPDEPTPTGSGSTPPPPPPPQEPEAAPQTPAASTPAASGMSADDMKRAMQEADRFDIGIVVIGVVTFLLSFFPYYTYDFGGGISANWSAWHGFFGWFGAFVALGAAGLLASHMMGIKILETSLLRLSVLGGFAVALLCIILALFVDPSGVDFGRGFGYWASLILVIAGTGLAFMRKDATD
jgi:hypothetical protein